MRILSSKILTALLIVLCMLMPIMQQENNEATSLLRTIETTSNKLQNDKLGVLKDFWDWGKSKMFDEENEAVRPLSTAEKIKNSIFTGFSFGLSSVGALVESVNNLKFKLYNPSLLAGALIFILLLVQLVINFISKLRFKLVGFFGLLTLLCIVLIIGSSAEDELVKPIFKGWFPFLVIQCAILYYSAKKARKETLNFPIV